MNKATSTILHCFCAVAFIVALIAATALNKPYDHSRKAPYALPALSYVEPDLIDVLTLNHRELYNDFIYIWLIQDIADDHRPEDWLKFKTLVHSVIRHKPKMESLYLLSCYTLFQDFKKPEECQPITMAGLASLPESWRIPMTQGFVFAFLLDEPAQAAAFFDIASSRQGAPPYLAELVKKLLSNSDLLEQDIQQSIETATDSEAGKEFIHSLLKLRKAKMTTPDAKANNPSENGLPTEIGSTSEDQGTPKPSQADQKSQMEAGQAPSATLRNDSNHGL